MADHPDLIALQRFREFRGVPGLREAIDRVSELVRGLEDASRAKDGMLEAQRLKLERMEDESQMHEVPDDIPCRPRIRVIDCGGDAVPREGVRYVDEKWFG